jgi:hypothetical protein
VDLAELERIFTTPSIERRRADVAFADHTLLGPSAEILIPGRSYPLAPGATRSAGLLRGVAGDIREYRLHWSGQAYPQQSEQRTEVDGSSARLNR